MANTYITEEELLDDDSYFAKYDTANTANTEFDANTYYANTEIISDYDETIIDTSSIANTSGSVGDVYDAGDTNLGTDITGITNSESEGVDAVPDAETVYDFTNGDNHAPQNIPDPRFFPQPVEAAPNSLYKKQQSPLNLSSAGVPMLGMLFNKLPQSVSPSNQSASSIVASKGHNTTGGRGANTGQSTRKVSRTTKGAGKNTTGNKMQCGVPKLITLNNDKNTVRVYCGNGGAYKDIKLVGGGDATKVVSKTTVKTSRKTYIFGCCKRKDDKGKDHYGVAYFHPDNGQKSLEELHKGKGQNPVPPAHRDDSTNKPAPYSVMTDTIYNTA